MKRVTIIVLMLAIVLAGINAILGAIANNWFVYLGWLYALVLGKGMFYEGE